MTSLILLYAIIIIIITFLACWAISLIPTDNPPIKTGLQVLVIILAIILICVKAGLL